MSSSLYRVKAYSVKHSYDISEFLEAYRLMLQKAIDEIWANIRWVEKFNRKGRRRLIPIIPKGNEFKHHHLRNLLMDGWGYLKHYVDSAIKQAYSIIKSWRRSYLKGERSRGKPIVKRRFVKVKETLYTFRDGKVKVSVKPYEEYIEFNVSRAWFWPKIPKNAGMGELILNEKRLTITFRLKPKTRKSYEGWIAWDCNERTLDGFNPKLGWIRVNLSQLFHIHRVYELKRRRLQGIASKKPLLRRVLAKYSRRERNRARDLLHKITTFLSSEFKDYIHGFESLEKRWMFGKSRNHNRNIAKSNWKTIIMLMGYKADVKILNPYNSTRRCSRCGMLNAPKGALYECRCGLRTDRQLNGAINLYLQMEGLPPSPKLFEELMKAWSGFTLTGEKADEEPDELKRALKLMNPKNYVCLLKTT